MNPVRNRGHELNYGGDSGRMITINNQIGFGRIAFASYF